MKRLITLVLLSSIMFSACKKDAEPTILELTIQSGFGGTALPGATVKLYANQTDYENRTNQIGATQVSDSNGKVRFADLSSVAYYFAVENGCENNWNTVDHLSSPVVLNRTNTATVITSSTFSMTYINNSSNPYEIYLNGVDLGALAGGSTYTLQYIGALSGSVRAYQLSGYVFTPTDVTAPYTTTCGGNLQFSFP